MNKIIQIENVKKNYVLAGRSVDALQDITLSVDSGDIYGIIGLSGAGKSTLIRALAGLVIPSSGRILFHGADVAKMKDDVLRVFRRKIGMIFQQFNLLSSRTAGENISYPMEIAGISKEKQNKRVDELLGFVGLSDKKNEYISRLSGGQKQRVGIARALANGPEVLLCDEATSALDPKTTKEILLLLKGVNQQFGVTIILITHEMDVIKQICNKVAVMDKGKIVESGLVSQIFTDPQHEITKSFLQRTNHDIPPVLLEKSTPDRKIVRLTFKGKMAGEPIISDLVRKCDVDVNILSGWIDRLETNMIGTLVVELIGTPTGISQALDYVSGKSIYVEVIENGC